MSPFFTLILAGFLCSLAPAKALPLGTYIALCEAAPIGSSTVYLNQYFTLGNAAQYDLYTYSAEVFSDPACSVLVSYIELQGTFVLGQPGSDPTTSLTYGTTVDTTTTVDVTWTSWSAYAATGFGPVVADICGFASFPEEETVDLFPDGCSSLGLPPQSSCANYYDVLDLHPTYIFTGYSNLTFGVCSPSQRTTVLDDVDIYTIPYYAGASTAANYCPTIVPNPFSGNLDSPTSPTPAGNSVSKGNNCLILGGAYNYVTGRVLEDSTNTDYCCLITGVYSAGNCVSGCNNTRPLDTANPNGYFYYNNLCYTRCFLQGS